MNSLAIVSEGDAVAGEMDARIADIVQQLSHPRQAIEETFADTGMLLMDCTKLLDEISQAHAGIPAELESEEFGAAAQNLEMIRDHITALTSAYSGEQDHLADLTRIAERIASPLSDLQKAVRAIRFIAVNARIAAAGIHGKDIDLAAFTTDMMELGQGVEKAVTAFADAHTRFGNSLQNARVANTAFSIKHGDTLKEISDRLGQHLTIVGEHRARAAANASERGRLTGQIRTRVSLAVSALQIGDIARQRVEHVEQALELLAAYWTDPTVDDAIARINTASAICHLQTAQLEETILEFDQQVADLGQSLHQLVSDTEEVLQAGDEEAASLLSSGGSALGAMTDDLGEIRTLLQNVGWSRTGAEEAINETADEVARSVSVMAGHLEAVSDLEHRIHQLSLNTVIQCERLGDEGAALKVIAQNLREIAGQTVAAANAVIGGLAKVDELTECLTGGGSTGTAERIAALETEADATIGMVETVIERLNDRVSALSVAGPQAVSRLKDVVNNVAGRQEFIESWRSSHTDLKSLAPLEPDAFDKAAIDHDRLSQMRDRYTMDSERCVHDTLLGIASAEIPATGSTMDAEEELDDIFF